MALEALSILDLDTSQPFLNVVHAKQFDSVRRIEAHLFFSGVKWYVPAQNIYALVSYKKSARVSGMYDYTEEGTAAVTVNDDDRSIIYINLDKSLLTAPGEIKVEVIFFDTFTEGRLSGFSFNILVEATALNEIDLQQNSYFSILSKQIAAVLNASGYIEIDPGLSESSTNPVQNRAIASKFVAVQEDWTTRIVNVNERITEVSRNVLPFETVYRDEGPVPSSDGPSIDPPVISSGD